jgi:hypothetical protein
MTQTHRFTEPCLTVEQIVERRDTVIDAIKAEFWAEHDKLKAESLRKIEEAEREYQQDMWRHLHRAMAA